MDRDSAEKEVARRIARANDDLRTELDVDEGKVTQFDQYVEQYGEQYVGNQHGQ